MIRQLHRRDRPLRRRRHRGRRARLTPSARWIGALAVVLVMLLLAAVVVLIGRSGESPAKLSCAPYGLVIEAPVRDRAGAEDRSALDVVLGREPADRFDLTFENAGVTSQYHVLAEGVDWDRPVGVVFRLHGDGAWEFESPGYNVSCLAEVARSHNMILVVPRSPDRAGEVTWWEERDRNAAWFRALVEERLTVDYDIDRSRTWLTGYSGGAQLISQELLADHIDLVPGGGAIMLGGGQAPRDAESEPARSQLRNLRLHWDVGRDDDGTDPAATFDALSAARSGHSWYEEAGFDRTSLQVRRGVDHFELPDVRILDRVLTDAERDSGDDAE